MTTDDTRSAPADDIVRATPRGRIALLSLIAFAIALLLCYGFFLLPLTQALSNSGNYTEAIATLKLIWVGCLALGVVPAMFLVRTGWKTLRLAQFPLPGAWVWRDTPIKRGPAAVRTGRLHILAGVIGLFLCCFLAGYSWLLVDRLLIIHELPAGVTVVSES